ncbi:hypothetical protein [Novosphingobium sp. YAF33]|uniref:hypothetical protein n=1 Tax=Novosphingobium sp. YAF33 TaxID=3233082 RepID=UPI003F9C0312
MPIDRAARALVKSESGYDDWDGLGPELQTEVRSNVCAVFDAIVEATPAMISAAEAVLQHRSGETTDQEIVQAIWHAMVEAALDGRPCTTRH